jgi:hypothetical protein
MTEGETHVPPLVGSPDGDVVIAAKKALGPAFPVASLFTHLILGWPL